MKRLEKILSLIEPCKVLADIGTDHGKLPYMVLKYGLAEKVIATDISEDSLSKAAELLTAFNNSLTVKCSMLNVQYECRLGNGLSVLKHGEADTVVITGMGARTISGMLMTDIGAKRYILSPQSEVMKFRTFLNENNFKILKEETVTDRKHTYIIFVCERTTNNK